MQYHSAQKIAFCIFLLFLCLAGESPANLALLNPSFEDSDMTPWKCTAISGIRPWYRGAASPQDGAWCVVEIYEASIEQSFDSILGSNIVDFSFWIYRPTSSVVFVELLFPEGGSSGRIDISSETSWEWSQYDVLPLIEPDDIIAGIRITKLGGGTTKLDNFHLNVVPEPGAGILWSVGLLVVFMQRNRIR